MAGPSPSSRSGRHPPQRLLVAGAFVLILAPLAHPDAVVPADEAGVRIVKDGGRDVWQIVNGQVEVEIGFDAASRLSIRRFRHNGRDVLAAPQPDGAVAIGSRQRFLANDPRVGIPLVAAGVESYQGGQRLWLRFTAPGEPTVTRSYAAWSDIPVIEMWSEVTAPGAAYRVELSPVVQVVVAGTTVSWRRGLRPGEDGEPFQPESQRLSVQQPALTIGGGGRSTVTALPILTVADEGGVVFAGLAWSGAWTGRASRQGAGTHVRLGLAGGPLFVAGETARPMPRAFLGAAADEASMALALQQFVVQGLRGGKGFETLTTYNTWFAHGTSIDAAVIAREMQTAAALGLELFQLDAGWYEGAGARGFSDFDSGLGSWAVDRGRFPEGLRPLGDLARSLGLRFGVWVEPERVDMPLVGREDGVPESWLATHQGRPLHNASETVTAGLICLSHPPARDWVLQKLVALVEEEGADYLKLDSNFWLNCDRDGHGHDGANGNAAHVQGLYEVLAALRERFPDLLIENCAGGGSRLDYGLLRYTDAAWMDDQSAPSPYVRRHLQGLGPVVPPGYLLSYAMAGGGERLSLGDDLHAIVASRMPGVLGFTYRAGELDEAVMSALAADVTLYKEVRDIVQRGAAVVLSGQHSGGAPPAWEAHQIVTGGGDAVVFLYQNDPAVQTWRVVPAGLRGAARYDVGIAGRGSLGTASGAELMADGFEVAARDGSAATVVVLRLDTR